MGFRAALSLVVVLQHASSAHGDPDHSDLRICGNFCGPDWCDGAHKTECRKQVGYSCPPGGAECSFTGETDGSCADACCKVHDRCCGSADRRKCNEGIIDCLEACLSGNHTVCKLGILPIPVRAILDGMELVRDDCCGERCGSEHTEEASSCSEQCSSECAAQNKDHYCCNGGRCCCYDEAGRCDQKEGCPCNVDSATPANEPCWTKPVLGREVTTV